MVHRRVPSKTLSLSLLTLADRSTCSHREFTGSVTGLAQVTRVLHSTLYQAACPAQGSQASLVTRATDSLQALRLLSRLRLADFKLRIKFNITRILNIGIKHMKQSIRTLLLTKYIKSHTHYS